MSIVTPDWVRDAVFYQIFPDRFARSDRLDPPGPFETWDAPPTLSGFKGGDLYGVTASLDMLSDLGVNALYLNPVFASASNHRYHTYDYLRVDPLLGGDAALRELLDEAHRRGMRVILDGVFNHASRGFWPFNHVLECGAASPYIDWFYLDREALAAGRPLRAYPTEATSEETDLSAWAEEHYQGVRSLETLGYRAWWDLPALPKLNTGNAAVREYLFGVAEHWLRFGIDGWRLDVPEEIDGGFWREFRRRVKAVNPDAYIVGEIWSDDPQWLQGDQFDAYMNYALGEAILSFCGARHLDMDLVSRHYEYSAGIRPEDGPAFARRLTRALTAHDPAVVAVQLNLLGSHDTPRVRTLLSGDTGAVRLAVLAQMTLPGAPCIYYGDEIGLEGGLEPACRGAFPTAPDRMNVALRDFVRGAARLRRDVPALRRGDFSVVAAEGQVCAYRRSDAESSYVVCFNSGAEAAHAGLVLPDLDGGTLVPVSWAGWTWGSGEPVAIRNGRAEIHLPAQEGRLLRVT